MSKKDLSKFILSFLLVTVTLTITHSALTEKKEKMDLSTITESEMLFYEGKHYFELGNYRRAIQKLDSAAILQPFFSNTFLILGKSFVRIGRPDSALISFNKVIELDPETYDARIEVSKILINFQLYTEAKELLKRAYRINPRRVEAVELLEKLEDTLNDKK